MIKVWADEGIEDQKKWYPLAAVRPLSLLPVQPKFLCYD
jgi:hypothetical protein